MPDKPADKPKDRISDASGAENLPKDPRELLGGYATGTLTDRELQYLMSAALEDQHLFDELQDEIALKRALEAPGARQRLLAKLEEEQPRAGAPVASPDHDEKPGWFRWQWGAVGVAAAALAVLTLVLLRPPTQNAEVAQLETKAATQLEAPTQSQAAGGAQANETPQAEPGIATVQSSPIPQAQNEQAKSPRAEARAADATAPGRRDALTATPAAEVVGELAEPQPTTRSEEATAAEAPQAVAPRAIPQPAPAPPKPAAIAKSMPPPQPQAAAPKPGFATPAIRAKAAAEAAQVADQATRQFRGAGAVPEGTATAQLAAGIGPQIAESELYDPVVRNLRDRAGPTGFAYQIVGRTLVILPAENGYLTITEGTGNQARAVFPEGQQVMSGTPVTIGLGAGNPPLTISFARSESAPAVEVRPGEAISGAVALPAGEDQRVTVTIPR